MARDAHGIANQGNRYAKIARSGTFAHFVSDYILGEFGLQNPIEHYLRLRSSKC